MKAIIVNGEIISICNEPNYVKKHPDAPCYTVAKNFDEAEGVAAGVGDVAGIYNLPGKPELIEGAPIAYIRDDGGSEYFFATHTAANKATADIGIVEESLCDNDIELNDRLTAIEDVLCQLDMEGNI